MKWADHEAIAEALQRKYPDLELFPYDNNLEDREDPRHVIHIVTKLQGFSDTSLPTRENIIAIERSFHDRLYNGKFPRSAWQFSEEWYEGYEVELNNAEALHEIDLADDEVPGAWHALYEKSYGVEIIHYPRIYREHYEIESPLYDPDDPDGHEYLFKPNYRRLIPSWIDIHEAETKRLREQKKADKGGG